ncbi:MAG: hypothetical protein GAK31_00379 [Stenotrophomonas maltophilia]|uniref:RES domain-containing protein n=1 Tax=Stenotrophomonas maltophilia TaxID=40324 RepID=A0A7V8FJ70_STEMA|nr:MAG: hypothetical protein GAK31_00379 [Stenotrophomonas maltophilia]
MYRVRAEIASLNEKQACADCLDDLYLVSQLPIDPHGRGLNCDYCGELMMTVSLEWAANHCESVFENFYQPTGDEMKVVIYGREPDGDDMHTCVTGLLPNANSDLIDDLAQLLLLRLDQEDGNDPDPYYIRHSRLGHFFSAYWQRMSESLRSEARLCNPLAVQNLESFFGPVVRDSTLQGQQVVKISGPGTDMAELHRARVFQSLDVLEDAMKHPEAQLGPLPKGMGRAGRMNASGVSVFYGATSAEVARAEVRPPVGSTVLLGRFALVRPMRLLDLDALSELEPDPALSLFDPTARTAHGHCDFLAKLVTRLTMPVMPQDEESSYLITQAIADYLATDVDLDLDGIVFRSAQASKTEEGDVGRNVVLFHKSSRVDKAELRYKRNRTAQVTEEDEGDLRWEPYIWWGAPPDQATWSDPSHTDQRLVSLSVVHDSLELHRIEAIKFTAKIYEVRSIPNILAAL